MNFGKLLAAGKSFVNTSAETSYRVNRQVYLPKFESPKNPFVNLPKPPPPQNRAPVQSNHIAAAQATRLPPPPVRTPEEHPTTWVSRLKASVLHDAPMPKRAELQPAVQAELSLDTVKVLHNDLSDAEVEVVPIKSRPAPPPDLPPARKSWEILGERLLKATAL
jgi:hypothetical protein